MTGRRRPDHGVPDQCLSAAEQVQGRADALAEAAEDVGTERTATDRVWSGRAADAFRTAVDTQRREADRVAARWRDIGQALDEYGRALGALQHEGDATRRRLSDAEDEVALLEPRLDRARTDVLAGDASAAWRVTSLTAQIADERRMIDRQWADLDELAADRAALDARTVEALLGTPGAGSHAWTSIAYHPNGAQRQHHQVVDDVVARLDHPAPVAADYDLLAQLLAMHGRDPETMPRLVDGLGATGLVGLVNAFASTGLENLHPPPDVTSADLCAALATALATASRSWTPQQQAAFGCALVDATGTNLQAVPGAEVIGVQAVAFLLGAAELAPGVALGALGRVEEIRLTDPARFAVLTHTGGTRDTGAGVFRRDSISLADSLFGQVARIPDQALAFFDSRPGAVTDYWFGSHDWSGSGFAGPAALLDAIVHSPTAQAGRWATPASDAWTTTVGFASRAFEALGGNLSLRVGVLSPGAASAIASALGAFVAETSAGLLVTSLDQDDADRVLVVGPDGTLFEQPALTAEIGNLARLLGIATLHPPALALYGGKVTDYARQVRDRVTRSDHVITLKTQNLLRQVGAGYAFLHGAYSLESQLHAAQVSDQTRASLDTVFTLASLAPGIPSSRKLDDYLVQVALVGAERAAASMWPGLKSPQELDAIIETGLDKGHNVLADLGDSLASRWGDAPAQFTHDGVLTTPADLIAQMHGQYTWVANASTNDVTSGALDVVVLGEDTPRNRKDMP